ncbi:hypothetical protein V7S43_004070 [Phytophthora oleae]|uniref:Myb-like domain-containing protein n=1 Tax=Phytophthora oleae TaxID=2107226 RepID=A0ABD3FYR4_9STRA
MGDSEHSFDTKPSPTETEPSTPASPSAASTEGVPWSIRIHDKRAKAFRFTTVTDTLLLREVLDQKPWSCSHGAMAKTWDLVAVGFKRLVPWSTNDGRACKRRYLALAEAYGTGKLQKLRGSGTPAQNAQRERLLSQCQQMTDEDHRRRKVAKEADRRAPVAQLALEDAARLTENGDAEQLTGIVADEAFRTDTSGTGQDLTQLLNDPRLVLRQRELELEERRMKLEERRVKLEEQRFEQQRQTADKQLEVMAAQTSVLLKLAGKLAGPGGLE